MEKIRHGEQSEEVQHIQQERELMDTEPIIMQNIKYYSVV